jgi:hypothetical protein
MINEIQTYLETQITGTGVYAFQRPPSGDSITVKPGSSPQANVEMWSQTQFVSIEVLKKASPQAGYNLCLDIRNILVGAKGILTLGGQRTLKIYAENTAPEVVDVTQDENDVYGITFRVKYIDNTIPVG